MDENVPRQITTGLKLRGVDVLTVQADSRSGLADPEVLQRATVLERVLFSRDDDLVAIACALQQQGTPFAGVVYAHPQTVSIGNCVKDLELIAKACEPTDCCGQVQFLPL
ncbi:MAG: DUF5615 family PIN-like protein [Leptolyngbyaceae cyanobacterium]